MKKILPVILVCLAVAQLFAVSTYAQIAPECVGMTMSGFTAVLTFEHTGDGLVLSDSDGFEVFSLGEWYAPNKVYLGSSDTVCVEYDDTFTMVRYGGGSLRASDGTSACAFVRQVKRTAPAEKTVNASLLSSGRDIYAASSASGYGYQYGPSSIVNPDGSIDVWTSAQGCSAVGIKVLDYIGYMHSDDGGETWSDRKLVLDPTPLSKDHFSCCDPGVIFFGGYYYIGYTSTIDHSGLANSVFVARSVNPDGPFEKWNGHGWGGDPEPIVNFANNGNQWGIGEPAFVELDGRLYIYYTLREWSANDTPTGSINNYTMVATADASDENWPLTIEAQGTAITMCAGHSGTDVKYHEESGKFIATAVVNGMTSESSLAVYESSDGLRFERVDNIYTNMYYYAHNNGMSGSPNGHIVAGDPTFITYAYGAVSGHWSTRLAPVEYTLNDGADASDTSVGLIRLGVSKSSENFMFGITPETRVHVHSVDDGVFAVKFLKYSSAMARTAITDTSNVRFSNYNDDVVGFSGTDCVPKSAGTTSVTAEYNGFRCTFVVVILPSDVDVSDKTLAVWEPYTCGYDIELGLKNQPMIRGVGITYSGVIGELFNNSAADSYDIDYNSTNYPVTYSGYNPRIIYVSPQGILVPNSVGSTTVTATVTCTDPDLGITKTMSFSVDVNVSEPKKHKITLDANGGLLSAATEYYINYKDPYSASFAHEIPVPTRAGYVFKKWIDPTNGATIGLHHTYNVNRPSTFVAEWQASENYTVSFDANGGVGAPAPQKKYIDVPLKLTITVPTKKGSKFLGWAATSDASEPDFISGEYFVFNTDAKLYAVWSENSDVGKTVERSVEIKRNEKDLVYAKTSDLRATGANNASGATDFGVTAIGHTVAFSNVENVKVIRCAKGSLETLRSVKSGSFSLNFTAKSYFIGADECTFSFDLDRSGEYTLCVEYNSGAIEFFTVHISD